MKKLKGMTGKRVLLALAIALLALLVIAGSKVALAEPEKVAQFAKLLEEMVRALSVTLEKMVEALRVTLEKMIEAWCKLA